MKKRTNYNAVLENWAVLAYSGGHLLQGRIYGDDKERFRDGDVVRTSTLAGDASLAEGNIVQTRNTAYLLGKRHGEHFKDGHQVANSHEEQMKSLRGYMGARGYVLVYSDSSVFWRQDERKLNPTRAQVAFATGVKWHNKAEPFSNEIAHYSKAADMVAFRTLRKVKLQKSGNRIVVQSHKVSRVVEDLASQLRAYQERASVGLTPQELLASL